MACLKPLVLLCFLSPTPLIKGVNFHPLNYGGMGCEGLYSSKGSLRARFRFRLRFLKSLVAPYRAILRYYRCECPVSRDTFEGSQHSPKMVRYPPPLVLSFSQAHLCDTPFCYVSRDMCAIPTLKQGRKSVAILSQQKFVRYEKYRCWVSMLKSGSSGWKDGSDSSGFRFPVAVRFLNHPA